MRRRSKRRPVASLVVMATAATTATVAVTRAVQRDGTRDFDERAQAKMRALASPATHSLARAVGHLAKWYVHAPLAAVAALALWKKNRTLAGPLTLVSASLAAVLLDVALEQRSQPRVRPEGGGDHQSYPSGHALESSAVALTAGWVLAREDLVGAWIAGPLVVASLGTTFARMALDRHWLTDIAGGYAAGLALGCSCAAVYEATRRA